MDKRLKKQFGQNFLLNHEVAIRFVDTAEIKEDDTVIEIGPGGGMITQYLIGNVKKLIAVEVDKRFVTDLTNSYIDKVKSAKFEIINEDILKIEPEKLGLSNNNYKVIGSLPYNISKNIIKKFLEAEIKPISLTVIIQKEVAFDYSAEPPKATFLSNYAKIFSSVELGRVIPKNMFKPEPKVDGAIVKFDINYDDDIEDKRHFSKFLKSAFLNRRKKLVNNLNSIYKREKDEIRKFYKKLDLEENARASEVTFDQWKKIYYEFAKRK